MRVLGSNALSTDKQGQPRAENLVELSSHHFESLGGGGHQGLVLLLQTRKLRSKGIDTAHVHVSFARGSCELFSDSVDLQLRLTTSQNEALGIFELPFLKSEQIAHEMRASRDDLITSCDLGQTARFEELQRFIKIGTVMQRTNAAREVCARSTGCGHRVHVSLNHAP